MLEEVTIRDLGVIDEAVLELSAGFTVVTGETGAGKTMVVHGLLLLFGGRGDAGRLRPGAERALLQGRLQLAPQHPAVVRAVEAGGAMDDDVLLLSRSVGADGRSRATAGGVSVPVGVLADIGSTVLAVHGQADQQRLLSPAEQRSALDRFAGEDVVVRREEFRALWHERSSVVAELAGLTTAAAERDREAAELRGALEDVAALAPETGEDARLAEEIARLAHADELRSGAALAQIALTGEDSGDGADALTRVVAARRALEGVAAHDPQLAALSTRIADAAAAIGDVAVELASYAASVESDPIRLAAAQERLSRLTQLLRRHGVADVAALQDWAGATEARLAEVGGSEERKGELAARRDEAHQRLGALAAELSGARSQAAARFGAAVSAELVDLAMPQAEVTVALTQQEVANGLLVGERRLAAGPDGVDEVALLLVPHRGAPPRPIHRGASGGELSRVMLAVEVVFAGAHPVPVMVFDEVDAGVGGRAAVEVGRRLARLARSRQVVVVTHLAQVAAFADRHLVVVKDSGADGAVTRSGVRALDDAARVEELARMLAGRDSEAARTHARELLDDANAEAASGVG